MGSIERFEKYFDTKINLSILQNGKTHIFQNSAFHYLCRPHILRHLSAYDFYSQYEVKNKTKSNENDLYQFDNSSYIHPSYRNKTQTYVQGVQLKENPTLIKIFQYDFPDSVDFNGNILDENTKITTAREQYACNVLLLFTDRKSVV